MDKKNLWQYFIIDFLVASIILLPVSWIVSYFNLRLAIVMLLLSPTALMLAVICMIIDYIKDK